MAAEHHHQHPWFHFIEDDDHIKINKKITDHHHGRSTPSPSSSIGEQSTDDDDSSNGSSSSCISSSDTKDDASSLPSSTSTHGSLYDLSDVMAQLPIKRGLSKFYNGKSESFASLSSVSSLEDLAKKPRTTLCNNRSSSRKDLMKASRSCGNGLNNSSCKRYAIPPKGLISKKPPPSSSSRAYFSTVSSLKRV